MEIDFERLIHLQKLDAEIKETSLYLENIPSQIEDIDKKIEESFRVVSEAKEKLAQNQKKRREMESNVEDIKVQITKYKQQLGGVKTNIEYKSLLKVLDEAQKKIDNLEEEIISEMLAADDIEAEISAADQKANKAKEKLSKEKDSLLKNKVEIEEKKEKFVQEREKLIPKIPSEQLNLYQNIFKKKEGISLSPVTDNFCSMCHMRIRLQMLNELKEKSKIILCENCGRILYWEKK